MSLDGHIDGLLGAVRAHSPLVHNITNYVVMDFSANALLAIGASPVMAHAVDEVVEMVGLASALVLNIGTLSPPWIDAMVLAGGAARRRGIPVILDPVGAGATSLRTDTARCLLSEAAPAVLRGNASEIMAVGSEAASTKGVDSTEGVPAATAVALELARARGTVVAVTGPEDLVTDGRRLARIANGHPSMGRITGSGCVASAIIGAFCAVADDPFAGAVAGLATYGVAGELAGRTRPRPGTYRSLLVDALDEVQSEHLRTMLKVSVEEVGP